MASSFTSLPPEIRKQIYAYLLAPTGRIKLFHFAKEYPKISALRTEPFLTFEPIEYEILRTCKQIYEEASHAFWNLNLLRIELPNDTHHALIHRTLFEPRVRANVRRIELRVWCNPQGLLDAKTTFPGLRHLVDNGTLGEVLLTISGGATLSKFGDIVDSSRYPRGRRPDDLFPGNSIADWVSLRAFLVGLSGDEAGKADEGCLSIIHRRLDLQLDMKNIPPDSAYQWLAHHPPLRSETLLWDVNKVFGGELSVDGVLCYKDEQQIRQTFRPWAEELEGKISEYCRETWKQYVDALPEP